MSSSISINCMVGERQRQTQGQKESQHDWSIESKGEGRKEDWRVREGLRLQGYPSCQEML